MDNITQGIQRRNPWEKMIQGMNRFLHYVSQALMERLARWEIFFKLKIKQGYVAATPYRLEKRYSNHFFKIIITITADRAVFFRMGGVRASLMRIPPSRGNGQR